MIDALGAQGPNDWWNVTFPKTLTEELNTLQKTVESDLVMSKINEYMEKDQDYTPFIEKILEKTLEKILESDGMEVLKDLFQKRESNEIQDLKLEISKLKALIEELQNKIRYLETNLDFTKTLNNYNYGSWKVTMKDSYGWSFGGEASGSAAPDEKP